MRSTNFCIAVVLLVLTGSCRTTKKSIAVRAETQATTAIDNSYLFNKPADGIHAPVNADLSAVQKRYPDVTMLKLNEGHAIYSQGACIGCHTPQNIYNYSEVQWEKIIDDMAFRANISDEQKDAVYKYVMAMKATQAK